MTAVPNYHDQMTADYTLIYWPTIPGRGEFVRLALEYTKTSFEDETDPQQVMKHMGSDFNPAKQGLSGAPALAPPMFIDHKEKVFLAQTPAILAYLGPKLGLAGNTTSSADAAAVQTLTLTFLDLNNEAHDVHHPIAVSKYYEDQKPAAVERAKDFRENRVPKFLGYAQRAIAQAGSGWVYGSQLTYADLTLFQIIEGLLFAFPNLMKRLQKEGKYADVFKLKDSVANQPTIKAYLQSDRRLPFSNGIFRHYPELDE